MPDPNTITPTTSTPVGGISASGSTAVGGIGQTGSDPLSPSVGNGLYLGLMSGTGYISLASGSNITVES